MNLKVIVVTGPESTGKSTLCQQLAEHFHSEYIAEYARDYVAERNLELKANGDEVQIDEKVTKILADSIGTDLTQIVGALQKLIDGRPEGVKVIDAALVERNIGISKDFNVFELQDALIKGDVVKANRITQYFASSKDHPMVKELGILYGFFANLMVYHYLPDKTDRAAASALGVSPFFVKDYAAAAKRYSAGKTFAIIGYFREIDARMKGINNPSAKDADLWKELIYKILH
jgi:DNA polymerase-3 subunit delta